MCVRVRGSREGGARRRCCCCGQSETATAAERALAEITHVDAAAAGRLAARPLAHLGDVEFWHYPKIW